MRLPSFAVVIACLLGWLGAPTFLEAGATEMRQLLKAMQEAQLELDAARQSGGLTLAPSGSQLGEWQATPTGTVAMRELATRVNATLARYFATVAQALGKPEAEVRQSYYDEQLARLQAVAKVEKPVTPPRMDPPRDTPPPPPLPPPPAGDRVAIIQASGGALQYLLVDKSADGSLEIAGEEMLNVTAGSAANYAPGLHKLARLAEKDRIPQGSLRVVVDTLDLSAKDAALDLGGLAPGTGVPYRPDAADLLRTAYQFAVPPKARKSALFLYVGRFQTHGMFQLGEGADSAPVTFSLLWGCTNLAAETERGRTGDDFERALLARAPQLAAEIRKTLAPARSRLPAVSACYLDGDFSWAFLTLVRPDSALPGPQSRRGSVQDVLTLWNRRSGPLFLDPVLSSLPAERQDALRDQVYRVTRGAFRRQELLAGSMLLLLVGAELRWDPALIAERDALLKPGASSTQSVFRRSTGSAEPNYDAPVLPIYLRDHSGVLGLLSTDALQRRAIPSR